MPDALVSQVLQALGLAGLVAMGTVIYVLVADVRVRDVLSRVRAASKSSTRIETIARRTLSPLGLLAWIPAVNAAADTLLVLAGDTLFAFDRIRLFGKEQYLSSHKYCWAGDICLNVEAMDLMVIDNVTLSGVVLDFALIPAAARSGGAARQGFLIPNDSARDAIYARLS